MVRRVSHPHFTPFSSFTSGHSRHHVHVHLVTSAPRSARRGSVLRSAGTCRSATSWSCPWPSRRRDAEQVPCVRRACGGMGHRGGWSEGGARRRSSRWEGHGGTTGCFTNLHLDAQGVVHGHPLAFNWLLVDTLSVVLANDGFISASASNGTRVYRSRLEGPHGRHALDSPGRFVDDAWTVDRGPWHGEHVPVTAEALRTPYSFNSSSGVPGPCRAGRPPWSCNPSQWRRRS